MATAAELLRLAAAASSWKRACRVASTSNLALSGLPVVDTVQTEAGDRVLATAQTDGTQNGIWVAADGAWWRADDWGTDTYAQLGTSVVVLEGSNAAVWTMTSPTEGNKYGAIALGTDEPVFQVASFLSHGNLAGGTLHATAVAGVSAGFISETDQAKLDNATDAATPDTLALRDADGAAAFTALDVGLVASGDTTGVTDRTNMVAALATGTLTLVDGAVYYISARIDIPSGATLNLGTAEIRLGSSWVASVDTDGRTESVFRIAGAASGTVNTTLAATEPHGSPEILVSSSTGISSSGWLRVYGQNDTVGFGGIVDSVNCSELVKVSSAYGGTTTVQLDSVTCYHADIGHAVVSWTPVESVTINGGYINTNSGTAATGIEITHAANISISGTKFRGFTRCAVDVYGSKFVELSGLVNRGQCNGFVFAATSHVVQVDGPCATGEFDRYHATGNARHQFWIFDHCVDVVVTDANLRKVCAVGAIWGGFNCGFRGGSAVDVDCAQFVTTAQGDERQSGMVGILFEGGPGPINDYTCFGRGAFMRDWTIVGVHQPSLNSQKIVYAHDHYNATLDNLTIVNVGQSALDAAGYLGGFLISDFTGTITNVNMKGTYRAIETNNFSCAVMIDNFVADAYAGAGTFSTQYGLYFDHQASGASPQIGHLKLLNYQGIMQFGASFAGTPDYTWNWDTLRFDGETFKSIVPVRTNSTVVRGTVGHMKDPTGDTYDAVIEATGPDARQLVFLGAASNGWTLAALGDAVALHTGTAAKRGDLLVADALGNLVVSANPPSNCAVYLCRQASASSRVQCVRLGAIPPFGALSAATSVTTPEVTATGANLMLRAPSGYAVKMAEAATELVEVSDASGVAQVKFLSSPGKLTSAGSFTVQPTSGGYVAFNSGAGVEIMTIVDSYLRLPTNTTTATIPAGKAALFFDGADVKVRIGATTYTLTKV